MGEALFAGSCSGVFFAFDKANGELRWAYDTTTDGPRANFHGDPVVTDKLIIVGSDVATGEEAEGAAIPNGFVYAFELATGDVRWKFALAGGMPSDLLRIGGSLYGVSNDGKLVCLDIAGGMLHWSVGAETETHRHAPRYSLLSIADRIVFSGPEGTLTAVDPASGKEIWARRLSGEVNTALVLAGSDVYVATDMQTIYRVDSESGAILAELPAPGLPYGTPIPLHDSLLVLLEGGDFARIETQEGRVLWNRSAESEWSSFRPRIWQDRVLVGNADGELIALGLEDGTPLERYRVDGAVRGFTFADGVFYIGTLEGKLFARSVAGSQPDRGEREPAIGLTCDGEKQDAWLSDWRARFLHGDQLAQSAARILGAPSTCKAETTGTFDGAKFGKLEFIFEDGSRLTLETWPPESSRVALAVANGFKDDAEGRGLLDSYAKSLGMAIEWSGPTERDRNGNRVLTYGTQDSGLNTGANLVYAHDRLVEISLSMAL